MWCTRWYLPLLLLPLPTASPYFLVLFLLSLTIHAKPCFYCIVLLSTLFISSCYWQPFPIDSPLTVPWANNVTTFSAALSATIMPNYTKPFPSVMRAVDRCWCDFSVGEFFEPFNVSHWEYLSVKRVATNLEREQVLEVSRLQEKLKSQNGTEVVVSSTEVVDEPSTSTILSQATSTELPTIAIGFWSRLKQMTEKSSLASESFISNIMGSTGMDRLTSASSDEAAKVVETPTPGTDTTLQASPPVQQASRSLEYDLRPYGLGIIVDLRWTR